MSLYQCPVCFYPEMEEPARDFNICECCGTEFGNDDWNKSHAELRAEWVNGGMHWFFGTPPLQWSPQLQVSLATSVSRVFPLTLSEAKISRHKIGFSVISAVQHAHKRASTSFISTANQQLGNGTKMKKVEENDFALAG